jgi:prepilin-type N-terminal cleavage/methylation domain-containing protein/prepilin-type processing-associated H-X9-DG protein
MNRKAFTLIEILVSISVIAIIFSILLGALQKARETAYSAQSQNNLRNMALATINCSGQNKGKTPPAWGRFRRSAPATGFVHLLPYLDQDAIYRDYMSIASKNTNESIINAIEGPARVHLSLFCSKNDITNPLEGGLCSYVMNHYVYRGGNLPGDYTDRFFELNNTAKDDLLTFMFDKEFVNGTSNTMLLCERAAICDWEAGDKKFLGKTARFWHHYGGRVSNSRTGAWIDMTIAANLNSNKPEYNPVPIPIKQQKVKEQEADVAKIQTFQSGGFNCAMADGSVKVVSPNISHDVFKAVTLAKTLASAGLFSQFDD